MNPDEKKSPILFFDGVCGLCNGFVDFLLSHDKNNTFYYAPLQGSFAKKVLPPQHTEQLNTVVLYADGRLYFQSDAVVEVLKRLGGGFKTAVLLKIFPRVFRDWGYGVIAKNRYKWFGKSAACRLPTPQEKSRFLN